MRDGKGRPTRKCSDCGTDLDAASPIGMCPNCLLELALDVTSLETEQLDREEAPAVALLDQTFAEGQIQGERYQIRSLLGRGGMGEVWRAYDLKLRQDVALKSLLSEMLEDAGALEMLRQEVRVARAVISPNVCRVFDLQEVDGQELVSMEYIDGTTLAEVLEERSPLDLDEAREIASQFLAGLEAVHDAGLVHRDIKPENIMITRTGRVVVMDFGIAKALQEGAGSFAGTPAYMSPEQGQAGELDARSDVFSAGVVLAEMVAPGGVRSRESRRKLLEGLHQEIARVADSPWSGVVRRAVAADPDNRFAGAAPLARALEEVTLRAAGEEEGDPYPGLEAFTQEQAKFFFGRELEVEALWKKLRRPHLMAVVGPSGAGKSSFLRAGLLPVIPRGWRAIGTTPGDQPFRNLALALGPELGNAPNAAELLPRLEEPEVAIALFSAWRRAHGRTLVIVDQFEELFTQSPPEVQGRFAELLGRLPLDMDVHVLLSMRDDFLLHCQALEPLAPVFSEITPLGPPTGASLRRAIVQPALKCGYRFQSESLVESMLTEVEGERGALPMLAFAARQLWQRRDRETGLLTEAAYESIGGVGGALAQHAEATLESVGHDRIAIVRELFRNLVTAQGTRAVRDRGELLSVFEVDRASRAELVAVRTDDRRPTTDDRAAAESVLDALVNARLLTSFEVAGDGDAAAHFIEIVHESLLTAWPRLVRWRAQDADTARMRDQLRQAARMWVERGQPDDLLWSGTAFKEYEVWRERYEGGLSAEETTFAHAMVTRAERHRRRRTLAFTVVIVLLLGVAGVIGALWLQSEEARRQAVLEARRAEASKLLALAQLEEEHDHTKALAYVLASLELADRPETRRFAARLKWRGPTYTRLPEMGGLPAAAAFSPDENWLAVSYPGASEIRIVSKGGGEPILLPSEGRAYDLRFSAGSDALVAAYFEADTHLRIWSVPDGRLLHLLKGETGPEWWPVRGLIPLHLSPDATRLITYQNRMDWHVRLQEWSLEKGASRDLGAIAGVTGGWAIDPSGTWLLFSPKEDARMIFSLPVEEIGLAAPRQIARHQNDVWHCDFDGVGRRVACGDMAGEIGIWPFIGESERPLRVLDGSAAIFPAVQFDDSGSILASGHDDGAVRIWDLAGAPGAEPFVLRFESGSDVKGLAIQPSGRHLVATNNVGGARLWPLSDLFPRVFVGHKEVVSEVAFGPDGTWIVSSGHDGVRKWPLRYEAGQPSWEMLVPRWADFDLSEDGQSLLHHRSSPEVTDQQGAEGGLVSTSDGTSTAWPGEMGSNVALSPDGRLAGSGSGMAPVNRVVHLWDTQTNRTRVLDAGRERFVTDLEFTRDGRLLAAYCRKEDCLTRVWNLADDSHATLLPGLFQFELSRDGNTLLGVTGEGMILYDMKSGQTTGLPAFDSVERLMAFTLDTSGSVIVTGDEEGVVRVGSVSGGQPHLLFGHEGAVASVAVSPEGRWIASGGEDGTLRLWPMPDLSQPPVHELPYDELLGKLRELTNLRAIRDPESPTGWRLDIGPFPGWEEVPTW